MPTCSSRGRLVGQYGQARNGDGLPVPPRLARPEDQRLSGLANVEAERPNGEPSAPVAPKVRRSCWEAKKTRPRESSIRRSPRNARPADSTSAPAGRRRSGRVDGVRRPGVRTRHGRERPAASVPAPGRGASTREHHRGFQERANAVPRAFEQLFAVPHRESTESQPPFASFTQLSGRASDGQRGSLLVTTSDGPVHSLVGGQVWSSRQ